MNKPRRPWIAALLTLLALGLGHLYAGNPKRGLILFCIGEILLTVLLVLLIFIFPDFIIFFCIASIISSFAFLVFCIVDAVSIAKRKKENYELVKYNRWFVYVGYFIILSLISSIVSAGVKDSVIKAYKIPAASMMPTLLVGDHVLVNKFIYGIKIPFLRKIIVPGKDPKRNDIIVFIFPKDRSKDFVKRVIGVDGDKIEIKNKKIFINDKPYNDTFGLYSDNVIYPAALEPRDNFGPVTVPKNSLFVMGDNRDQSMDSRYWGFVDLKDVEGKVFMIYWSRDGIEKTVRWDRVGLEVK
jgi:signal peptidase I